MFASLVIVFREVFEAGLIVGIVMAVTSGVAGRTLWIGGGVAAGVLGACAVALFTSRLSALFDGSGQEIFNASILSFAVLMLTWHNVWMARHGRELAAEMRAAGQAVVAGSKSLAALALVVRTMKSPAFQAAGILLGSIPASPWLFPVMASNALDGHMTSEA